MGSFFQAGNQGGTINQILNSSHFTLKVDRQNLLEDSLNQLVLNSENQQMLRKPLRIQFAGEPGIDEGGVKKEFF